MFKTLALAIVTGGSLFADAVISPTFWASYTLVDLGAAPLVPGPYGGLIVSATDPNTLLIGGAANGAGGVIDAVGVIRDASGHITGFTGTNALFSTAPNIDGGLIYAPNGTLLYTAYPDHAIREIKPGSAAPGKIIAAPGSSSVGAIQFVPAGFAGAGNLIVASYNAGAYCTSSLTPDSGGTYDVGDCGGQVVVGNGPEGLIYVPLGSALFSNPSVLVSEYTAGRVSAYTISASGLPDPLSQQDFITGLSGAEGAAIDPVTGDFLFSTFGGSNHVFAVQGFVPPPAVATPEPGTLALLTAGIAGLWASGRQRTA